MDPNFIIAGLAVAEIQERTSRIETELEMRRTMTRTQQPRFGRLAGLLPKRRRRTPAGNHTGCPERTATEPC